MVGFAYFIRWRTQSMCLRPKLFREWSFWCFQLSSGGWTQWPQSHFLITSWGDLDWRTISTGSFSGDVRNSSSLSFLVSTINSHNSSYLKPFNNNKQQRNRPWSFLIYNHYICVCFSWLDSRFVRYLPSVLAASTMLHVIHQVEPCHSIEYQTQLLGVLNLSKVCSHLL